VARCIVTHTTWKTPTTEELNMKRLQQSVLLAGVLALSQLTACSSIGWKGFGNSPMPAQATPSPVAAATPAATPAPPAASVSAPAATRVTASATASGNDPAEKN
jgi:hypothetical protein